MNELINKASTPDPNFRVCNGCIHLAASGQCGRSPEDGCVLDFHSYVDAWRTFPDHSWLLPLLRTISIKVAINIRNSLCTKDHGYSRQLFNQAIYAEMKRKAIIDNAHFYREDKCYVKGHLNVIANGYSALYDAGVDVPVTCRRCGLTEM